MPFLIATMVLSLTSSLSTACYTDSLPEDLNGDGKVDLIDVFVAVAAFASYPGHERWNPQADINDDGKIDITDIARIASKFGSHVTRLSVTVSIHPRTLNLKSQGRWVTVYITFLDGCNVSDIDVSTLKLNDTICAKTQPINVGNNTLMVKFSRATVESYIQNATTLDCRFTKVALTVSGKLKDGTIFAGSDYITVIAHACCYYR